MTELIKLYTYYIFRSASRTSIMMSFILYLSFVVEMIAVYGLLMNEIVFSY